MEYYCSQSLLDYVGTLAHEPWKLAVKPFQVSPRTWYVSGQSWVGSYLIDTGDGCLLIDAGIPESLYLLVNSLYELGRKPSDIKKILISHGHFDHFGAAEALRQLTGAELWMSKIDARLVENYPEEAFLPALGSHPQTPHPDHFYSDDEAVTLGDISVRTLLTPGHTPGCTSFFWNEENPVTHEVYTVAMHGGVGGNTMNNDYYAHSQALTPALRDRFLSDIPILMQIPVDIALPSHPNQIPALLQKAGTYTHERQPYHDEAVWPAFLKEREDQIRELLA